MLNCSICSKELNQPNNSGLCKQHYQAKWRSENKEHIKLKKKEYEFKNKDKIKSQKKAYTEESKIYFKQKNKEWYDANKTDLKNRYNKAKSGAKQRDIEFNISFEEYENLIKSATCHYCPAKLDNNVGHNMDRISYEIGYNINNVLPCCNICNKARNTFFTVEEWEVAMKAILKLRAENEC